ncbi:serine protease [Virgisporangium aliadipatigenens]|uniref:Serine protease n=1 Tax=Virgisporangium aliadipatigenens TaxID=741659 RepID=A0A8J3YTW1_9ACTN|nr:S8 family serine peptidase [Virgisporangium aliadipatigenens]GIJ50552.1 serine protease [Virgisporangium aliadipatigenens]
MRQRRLLAYGTSVATLATLLIVAATTAAGAEPPGTAAARPDPSRTVTLFTGDRVAVAGGQLAVTPRPGVQFLRFRRDKADYVVPSDALALLKADRLDERLFNVTALLEYEFDKIDHLPLVVSDASAVYGLSSQRELDAVDGFATTVPVAELSRTWQSTRTSLTGGKIWLDGIRKPTLDVSVPMTGAPGAWAAGFDGSGVTVAVIDTGVDDSHPDLAGKVVARRNFVPDKETGLDVAGHGTHVASTVAGTGAASDGKYRGVAPGAALIDAKVCWSVPGGGACSDSAILEAMQWAAASGAKVVNMSLGGPDQIGIDPLEQAVNDLSAQYGTLFVCSAGNWGGSTFRVGSPGTADAALSVANFDKSGELYWSSLHGPRIGDYAVKPDIAAPGTDITAARSPSAAGLPEGPYIGFTGTSMAAPHVAGTAALLAQARPGWNGARYKESLMAGALPNPGYDVFAQGAGMVNVARSLGQPVTVSPPSLSIGVLEWPHTEAPSGRSVTYRNDGDVALTLALSLESNAPAGLLSLGAETVTVPARGTASVEVRADEKASDAYGFYSGRLVATGGDVTLRTPVSVDLEAPSATLKVNAIGRDGAPPAEVMLSMSKPDPSSPEAVTVYTPSQSLRAPLGSTWHVAAYMRGADGSISLVTFNKVTMNADREIVLDARKAKPVHISVPDRKAKAYDASLMVHRAADGYPTYDAVSGDPATLYTADAGPGRLPGVISQVHAVFQGPPKRGASPDVYQFGWRTEGAFVNGFRKDVKAAELSTVDVDYGRNATGVTAWRSNMIPEPSLAGAYPLSSELPPVTAPAHRVEYYSGNVPWRSRVVERDVVDGAPLLDLAQQQDAGYRSGRRHSERWNGAVFSTTVAPAYVGSPVLVRQGNSFYAGFSAFADGAGHIGWPYAVDGLQLSLRRGDTELGEYPATFGSWEVGADPAGYRLRFAVDLGEPFVLSRRTETEWTFRSSAVQEGEVPLTSIGLEPQLGPDNSARAGEVVSVPLTFVSQGPVGRVRSATVSASYDEGRTWVPAPTVERHGKYTAQVRAPHHHKGFVALRVSMVDSYGNTTTTKVLRAYRVG